MKRILLFGLLAGLLNACSKENIPLPDFVNASPKSMKSALYMTHSITCNS